jgi:glycosyltransferase involved in cell wall biosynthesis
MTDARVRQEAAARPRLTIGMPLYNNARTLERAVRSLLRQTFTDFVLLLSDDGSKDDTARIARELAAEDPRIVIVQQPVNLNYGNFRYVLEAADTELFVFAAGDDWWEPEFLEACVALLDEQPDAVLVTPLVRFFPDKGESYLATGTFPLTGSPAENVAEYLEKLYDNTRMYGVFRTGPAKRAFPRTDHHAFDLTFSIASLRDGVHLEIPRELMGREVTPTERYVEYVRRDNPSALSRLFPLLPMTRSLLFEMRVPRTRRVLRALCQANMVRHRDYMRRYHPRLFRAEEPVLRASRLA